MQAGNDLKQKNSTDEPFTEKNDLDTEKRLWTQWEGAGATVE